MRKVIIVSMFFVLSTSVVISQSLIARGGWVAGYVESWEWKSWGEGYTDTTAILAMNCFTHIYWVCANDPGSNGSIGWQTGAQAMLTEAVPVMKRHGIKSIFQMCCNWSAAVGTTTTYAGRKTLITNLCNVLRDYQMDGIDVDWEAGSRQYEASFINQLRDSLDARFGTNPRKQIVVYADAFSPDNYTGCINAVDHLNVVGYDIVSVYWSLPSCATTYNIIWHQGPPYSGGTTCPSGQPNVNLNDLAQKFVARGYPKSKIGISARWNATIWRGGAGTSTGGAALPLQTWSSAPFCYNDLRHRDWAQSGVSIPLLDAATVVHDNATKASYITYDPAGSTSDAFVSYDDGWGCSQKVKLVQDSLYGGVYVWTVSGRRTANGHWEQADSLRVSSNRGSSSGITGTFSVTPDSLPVGGGSVTLSWTSLNATSASISPSIGSVPLSGSTVVTVSSATTFTLTLTNAIGSRDYSTGVFVQLPSGHSGQDITAQATAPIALITQPTGRGNSDIEVIRDGFTPPISSTDTSQQYATYNGGGARATDWIGYQFPSQHPFSGLVFQEGMQFADGGWFTSLNVQVRVSGQWVSVQNLQITPPYAGANGINYESYDITFTPITGDRIRITGTPGGSAHYVTVAELRIYDNTSSGVTPIPSIPRDYALLQNYPNPFNPTTKISFNVPVGSDVTIVVYNVLGQEIATLGKGYYEAGRHTINFSGDGLPNGIYFYSIKAGNFMDMKKMVLLK